MEACRSESDEVGVGWGKDWGKRSKSNWLTSSTQGVTSDHDGGPRPRWARREGPVILTVDAAAMHAAGHAFYQAANGVWLTDHVPPGDLSGWPG